MTSEVDVEQAIRLEHLIEQEERLTCESVLADLSIHRLKDFLKYYQEKRYFEDEERDLSTAIRQVLKERGVKTP